jgi:hypothetical protein
MGNSVLSRLVTWPGGHQLQDTTKSQHPVTFVTAFCRAVPADAFTPGCTRLHVRHRMPCEQMPASCERRQALLQCNCYEQKQARTGCFMREAAMWSKCCDAPARPERTAVGCIWHTVAAAVAINCRPCLVQLIRVQPLARQDVCRHGDAQRQTSKRRRQQEGF